MSLKMGEQRNNDDGESAYQPFKRNKSSTRDKTPLDLRDPTAMSLGTEERGNNRCTV